MKLSSITLQSFRSAENLELGRSAALLYICGRNGAGKSSVREAIRWTLRGVCSATDKKGQGWEDLTPSGRTGVVASIDIEGIGSVARAYANGTRALSLQGRSNEIAATQAAVYELLKTTPEFLDACLETSYFLDLHHADSKAFILGLLDVKIPYGGKELTLDQLDAEHDVAFKQRTMAKAELKIYRVLPRPDSSWGDKPASVEEVESRLAGLEQELRGHERIADTNKGKREGLQARLENLRREVSTGSALAQLAPPPDLIPALEKRVQALADQCAQADAVKAVERHMAAPPAPEGADHDQIIATLTAHKPTKGCVLDPGVECRTPKIVFTNRVKWYKEHPGDQFGGLVQSATLEAPPAGSDGAPGPFAELAGARADLKRAMEAQAAHVARIALLADRQNEIDAITAQLASLPIGTDPVDMTAIETLKARIAKGKIVLEAIRGYWRAMEAHTRGLQEESRLKAKVEELEARVHDLGPNGLRVEALQKSVGAFEEAINKTTQTFGWKVAFQIQPWEVLVNGRPLVAYSESERFRIGIAVQLAVAQASGLRFIVVDRLDMLDRENRGNMTQLLANAAFNLGIVDQVVILSTREDDQPLPQMLGCAAYRLAKNEQGQTVVAEERG